MNMVFSKIPIEDMSIQQLFDLLEQYPWFTNARRELYLKLCEADRDCKKSYLKKYVPYIFSARAIADKFVFSQVEENIVKDNNLIKDLIVSEVEDKKREIFVVGGDYFGKEDLKSVQNDTNILDLKLSSAPMPSEDSYFTETLAKVYTEQGFYQRAIDIYEKLILLYPEKNTYFATLIVELKKNI